MMGTSKYASTSTPSSDCRLLLRHALLLVILLALCITLMHLSAWSPSSLMGMEGDALMPTLMYSAAHTRNSSSSSSHLSARMQAMTDEADALNRGVIAPPSAPSALFAQLHPEVQQLLTEARGPLTRVPKLVHFIHGLKTGGSVTFTYIHYLAVKAAHDFVRPHAIYMHCRTLPSGPHWEAARPYLTIRHAREVTTIFGREISHFAHKADVIRLEVLLHYGGIYLDIDVIALRSFDSLLSYDMVMGEEQTSKGQSAHGLGNGVIIAKRDSRFLQEWYRAYRHFNQSKWAELSVHYPLKLAYARPGLIHMLPNTAFFSPIWDRAGSQQMYDLNEYDLTHNFAVHVWNSDKQRVDNAHDICMLNNTFGRVLRIAMAFNNSNNPCPTKSNALNPAAAKG